MPRHYKVVVCCWLLYAFSSPQVVFAETAMIAVASNFTTAMKDLAQSFEKQTTHKISLVFGSSGKIYAQIMHGAPFDVFLSADTTKPEALIKNGHAVASSQFTYAIGALALWSKNPELIDGNAVLLKSNHYNKLALANPRLAPYGAAAIEVLTTLQLVDATRSKWVQGENISQTYQFVNSGNADLGFVALSQLLKQGKIEFGSVWVIPTRYYAPIRQDGVLLKQGEVNPAAIAFISFIRSDPGLKIIQQYGYLTAE